MSYYNDWDDQSDRELDRILKENERETRRQESKEIADGLRAANDMFGAGATAGMVIGAAVAGPVGGVLGLALGKYLGKKIRDL